MNSRKKHLRQGVHSKQSHNVYARFAADAFGSQLTIDGSGKVGFGTVEAYQQVRLRYFMI